MTALGDLLEIGVSAGTILLATATFWMILQTKRENDRNRRSEVLRRKLMNYYSPAVQSFWNGFPSDFKTQIITQKVSENLFLAESDTAKLINEEMKYLNTHNLNQRECMTAYLKMLVGLFDLLWADYVKLSKEYYESNGMVMATLTKLDFWNANWDKLM
jgi:hypothetical protein